MIVFWGINIKVPYKLNFTKVSGKRLASFLLFCVTQTVYALHVLRKISNQVCVYIICYFLKILATYQIL